MQKTEFFIILIMDIPSVEEQLCKFNNQYGEAVRKHASAARARYMYNGTNHVFSTRQGPYGEYDLCITPAPEYRIHPSIVQLLEIGNIRKLHAETLIIKLSWDFIANFNNIGSFCGITWSYHLCSRCNASLRWTGKWVRPKHDSLCEMCYQSTPNKFEYRFSHETDFRIMDWIMFIDDSDSMFFTNCNTQSPMYGKILHCTMAGGALKFNMMGTADDLLTRIQEWMECTSIKPLPEKTMVTSTLNFIEYVLNTYVTDPGTIQQAILYGIIKPGESLTYRRVLENRHRVQGVNQKLIDVEFKNIKDIYRLRKLLALDSSEPDDTEIMEQAIKRVTDKASKPIFECGLIHKIDTAIHAVSMYKDDCARVFSKFLQK